MRMVNEEKKNWGKAVDVAHTAIYYFCDIRSASPSATYGRFHGAVSPSAIYGRFHGAVSPSAVWGGFHGALTH